MRAKKQIVHDQEQPILIWRMIRLPEYLYQKVREQAGKDKRTTQQTLILMLEKITGVTK